MPVSASVPKLSKSASNTSAARPRRAPRQERSKLTVDAILEATKRLIVRRGLKRVTTNEVARTAGVSIGSLYQYFPSKGALIAELRRRHQNAGLALLLEHAEALADAPLPVALRHFVTTMIAVHRAEPVLHRALELEGRLERVGSVEQRVLSILRAYLERHRGELALENLDQAAFVVGVTVESLTHGAVLDRPELLSDDSLTERICAMLLAYLTGAGTKH